MKRILATLFAGLLLATALPSLAVARDRDYRGDRHSYGQRGFDRGHDRHRRHSHANALGWGLAGLTVGGILFSMNAPSPPVMVAPTPVRPPGRMWYYCDAYGTYYPYVGQCPGGWRAVPAY
ncbi:MAG: hypothetical protein Q8M20_07510 [Rhodocyclaceae bacterium]|nr:hypothetical protein [Rhodocyclaceae bacterium]MDZ4214249.1 hypothetical protein [Rhodocyclaceae bacterium]